MRGDIVVRQPAARNRARAASAHWAEAPCSGTACTGTRPGPPTWSGRSTAAIRGTRSEERRVGKERRSGGSRQQEREKRTRKKVECDERLGDRNHDNRVTTE